MTSHSAIILTAFACQFNDVDDEAEDSESLGGREGQSLVDQADSWMRSQAIRNPARMVAMHAPGFPE